MSQIYMKLWNRIWLPLALVIIWLVLQTESHNPFFPAPSKIWNSAKYIFNYEWITFSLGSSLVTLISGFIFGSFFGVFFGAILGSNKYLREIFLPITNFIRCIPSVAKIPVITALIGYGIFSRILTISIAVLFPVLLSTLRAVANTDENLIENVRIFGWGFWRTLIQLKVLAATGEILAGLQAALQVAVLVMVVSEMLGSGVGLGAFIIRAQSTFMFPDMWLGVIILGFLGVLLNIGFHFLEIQFAPWYFAPKSGER